MERLSAQDLMMLWPEELGWSQDIGAIAILDGRGLLDADGRFRIEMARDQVQRRLHLVPRFRQLLYRPRFGLGWPLWVDAPSVEIAEHVRVLPLDAPADERRLLLACEELRQRRLDRSRPLWEMWFLPGLPDGRVGFFMKLHHAIADGMAGIAALGAFVDLVPDPPETSEPPWTPAPMPSTRELLGDNVRRHLQDLGRAFTRLDHPVDTLRRARRGWPAVHEAFAEARAPRTSLNQRIGWHRRFALVRSDLALVKRIAHASDAKVNDVLMVVLAGGLRELLLARGERVDGVVLRAFVPVSLHGEQPGQARGNLDGAMLVPLPIGEPDDVRRLQLIAAETARAMGQMASLRNRIAHSYGDLDPVRMVREAPTGLAHVEKLLDELAGFGDAGGEALALLRGLAVAGDLGLGQRLALGRLIRRQATRLVFLAAAAGAAIVASGLGHRGQPSR